MVRWPRALRKAGFNEAIDTEDAFRNALQSLIDHEFLPPAANYPPISAAFHAHT